MRYYLSREISKRMVWKCVKHRDYEASVRLTRNERVHSIHGHELLSKRIRNASVVDARARYAANGLTCLRDSADHLGQGLANNAPPVCSHADLESWMPQDGGGPFHGVDLGHQGRVDEASLVEDLIAVLAVRVLFLQAHRANLPGPITMHTTKHFTYGIVLHRKQRMQHFHANPPVIVEPSLGRPRDVSGQELLLAFLCEQ